jgi:hypothetical protein
VVNVYTTYVLHIRDFVHTAYELAILPNNIAGNTLVHKSGGAGLTVTGRIRDIE